MKQQPRFIEFDGLGTHWECEIMDENLTDDEFSRLSDLLTDELNRFTKLYSRFDDKSLIGKLNKQSKLINPPSEMRDMFLFAKNMFEVSEGAFNVSVGGVLNAKGYGKSDLAAEVKLDFWENVIVSDNLISIPKDSVVDLGGFGKGWLIDKYVEILSSNKVKQFIVNGGGDLFVQSNVPIEIALEHPIDSTKKIGQTQIAVGALAASSTLKRIWRNNGNNYNHIINPFSDQSSDNAVVGTFIKADTALMADTMATILLIKPELNDNLSEKFGLQTILVTAEQIKS